ncbi:hypothetical protein [Streptomyces cellulosae]|uniref:hypothetical protein n=1 Tax=Streptomyces cellulosae TaxID=1968 RepID=UPI00131BF291|nr:hypothetical protein [Streptomyces cellulosae]
MPLQRVWEHAGSLTPDTKSTGDTAPARLLFEEMTRHRDPSELVNFLASHSSRQRLVTAGSSSPTLS